MTNKPNTDNFCHTAMMMMAICSILITMEFNVVSSKKHNLQFVYIVTRHGSRGPLYHYANDPYKNKRYWPDGKGALTANGKKEMYRLGQQIGDHYKSFLNRYYQKYIYVRSTRNHRTYRSCVPFLSGMFPEEEFSNPHSNSQKIHIWKDSIDKRNIVTSPGMCPAFTKAQALVLMKEFEQFDSQTPVISYLEEKSGTEIKTPIDFIYIWDPLLCEDKQGLKLENWTSNVYPKLLKPIISNLYRTITCGSQKQKQLVSGLLLKDISNWFINKKNGKKSEKMLLHSGHDLTILGLLCALGIVNDLAIYPASALSFELHRVNANNHFIQLRYNNGSCPENGSVLLPMPNCPEPCTLHKFLKFTKEFEPHPNWKAACHEK